MNSEQIIKNALDGHFWSLSMAGDRICHTRVPVDYIPDHLPVNDWEGVSPQESGRKGGMAKFRSWSYEEDNRLLELRAAGLRWQVIGFELKRGDKNARLRYYELCAERGIKPVSCIKATMVTLTDELKARIVELREKGWGFPEINAELGLTGFKARDYYSRYKRAVYRANLMQEAA